MRRRSLLLGLGVLPAVLTASCATGPGGLVLAPDSTLAVTRHGDREGGEDYLSTGGKARAVALVAATNDLGLTRICSPGIARNLATAAPLAKALNLPIQRIPQEAPTAALVQQAATGPVIWIGNKGNIRKIWSDLGLQVEGGPLGYGQLHILRADAAGKVTVERRTYGPA
ncbi:histidine phosphatase family protein [Sagittula salina]|uniref:Histidine phosphatase family protein n=1 Tax=Sagittula salina TaxID=2820268 RepID=A0A940MU43_9RHOB|nr:histidine phosphatase family protein [Sagittula salina]MBP0483987.1 histidine phosphatase family protein [Sagittula salina]